MDEHVPDAVGVPRHQIRSQRGEPSGAQHLIGEVHCLDQIPFEITRVEVQVDCLSELKEPQHTRFRVASGHRDTEQDGEDLSTSLTAPRRSVRADRVLQSLSSSGDWCAAIRNRYVRGP